MVVLVLLLVLRRNMLFGRVFTLGASLTVVRHDTLGAFLAIVTVGARTTIGWCRCRTPSRTTRYHTGTFGKEGHVVTVRVIHALNEQDFLMLLGGCQRIVKVDFLNGPTPDEFGISFIVWFHHLEGFVGGITVTWYYF